MSDHTPTPEIPIRMLEPQQVAPDTYVVRQLAGEGVDPVAIHMNSSVIVGAEPVVIDTGLKIMRYAWMEATFSLVDPADVRWIYLSHDDGDHVGNLAEVMEMCPQATIVTTWFMAHRIAGDHGIIFPPERMRWVNDGESFHAGDRELVAKLPPVFDSPTTRGLFDTKTGVYWASDAFAAPVTHEVDDIDDLDPGFWREAFSGTNRTISPWHQFLDPVKYSAHIESIRRLGASVVTSAHGVTLHGAQIESGLKLLEELPLLPAAPQPGQVDLEAMVAAMAAAPAEPVAEAVAA